MILRKVRTFCRHPPRHVCQWCQWLANDMCPWSQHPAAFTASFPHNKNLVICPNICKLAKLKHPQSSCRPMTQCLRGDTKCRQSSQCTVLFPKLISVHNSPGWRNTWRRGELPRLPSPPHPGHMGRGKSWCNPVGRHRVDNGNI